MFRGTTLKNGMTKPKQKAETPSVTPALSNSPRTTKSTVHTALKTPNDPQNSPHRIAIGKIFINDTQYCR
jgi:hypothetical protein